VVSSEIEVVVILVVVVHVLPDTNRVTLERWSVLVVVSTIDHIPPIIILIHLFRRRKDFDLIMSIVSVSTYFPSKNSINFMGITNHILGGKRESTKPTLVALVIPMLLCHSRRCKHLARAKNKRT
jgi:hypothetical protein